MLKFFNLLLITGLLTSIYLTYVHYSSNVYVCPVGNNCDKVLTSKYSKIFNIPISFFGAVYFFLLLNLSFLMNRFLFLFKIINFFLLAGFSTGLILLYIQIFILKTICFYCFVVDSILLILPIIFNFHKALLICKQEIKKVEFKKFSKNGE